MVRVDVSPAMLAWARERARVPREDLVRRFRRLPDWEAGEVSPTLKQLENYARSTHTSLGLLLLPEPPLEAVPIPDFRTMAGEEPRRTSADLLDTIYLCQQRQAWYRDYARANRAGPVTIVGALSMSIAHVEAAERLRQALEFDLEERAGYRTWAEALSGLAEHAEDAGVLVMANGVVGSNTHRKLDPQEFRGFALADPYAPVVFVNAADTKAARIFTLAHELAHLGLGQAALDDVHMGQQAAGQVERWCNGVAAEVLVPLESLRSDFDPLADLTAELERLARVYKVSTLVVLRRAHDLGALTWEAYRRAYHEELERVMVMSADRAGGDGGDFYKTTPVRTSKRFARAIVASTLEGHTLYRDAARLLGFKKLSTLEELAKRLGVA